VYGCGHLCAQGRSALRARALCDAAATTRPTALRRASATCKIVKRGASCHQRDCEARHSWGRVNPNDGYLPPGAASCCCCHKTSIIKHTITCTALSPSACERRTTICPLHCGVMRSPAKHPPAQLLTQPAAPHHAAQLVPGAWWPLNTPGGRARSKARGAASRGRPS
jgi:hypothetical protein